MLKQPDRTQRKVLGKGLSALLPTRQSVESTGSDAAVAADVDRELLSKFGQLQNIPLNQIQPNQEQPRAAFDPERLNELAQSLRMDGLLQPITVFSIGPNQYRIVAGERRWRAAQIAGFTEILAIVRTVEQHRILELALVENIQREDLNPIEVAMAFQSLAEHHGLQHDQIAERTGKNRSTITNFLRLLRLSNHVQQALKAGTISAGHARALLNLPEKERQQELCERIIKEQLSVRETERLVRDLNSPPARRADQAAVRPNLDANVKAALDDMSMSLGTKITLHARTPTSGRLEIEYYSQEDLDRIYLVITKQ